MSHPTSDSERRVTPDRNSAVYHAGVARHGLPSQYQASDVVHQTTSEIPRHPSRPPNFIQPWRMEHPSSRLSVLDRTYPGRPETGQPPSMGNKNDSDKGTSLSHGNVAAGNGKGDLMRLSDGHDRAASGDGHQRGTVTPSSHPVEAHSSEWIRHGMTHAPSQDSVTGPHVVPLVTPAALADLGHLYKLPTSGLPSQQQIYPSGILNPLYTSGQYPTYASHSAVQVTTVPTFSPYLAGQQLGYPLVAAQGSSGPGPYPTVESYSAMLASMGSQVQQAQGARLPVSTYLPPGVISLPYGSQLAPGAPSLSLLPKGAMQDSVPAVAYLNPQLPVTGVLQGGHHVLTSLVPVSGGVLGFPTRTEDELNRINKPQETDRDPDPKSNVPMAKAEDNPLQGDVETAPFSRRSFQTHHYPLADKPDDPRSKNARKVDMSPQPSSADYQDRKPYPSSSVRHESVITAVSAGSDKSRPVSEDRSSYAPDEGPHWGSHLAFHEEAPNPFPNSAPPHSPQVRFHLSPSPQVRPSPTISRTQSAEADDVIPAPPPPKAPSSHMTAYVPPAADRIEQGPPQPPDLMTLAPALSPGQPQAHSLAVPPEMQPPSFNNIPSYFTRGSIIQLASGELKRVEDIRTEDFVHSAKMCEGLKIDSSTVVRIHEHSDNGVALISFLVGAHKAQVSLEAPMEHPFFVFGQGWSAVRPDRSLKSYSLGCHKLAVGDVCVSLTVKDKNGRFVHHQQQQQQMEQPLPPTPLQVQPPLQQQQQPQVQARIPMPSLFPVSSREPPVWASEHKRPRVLEPVQEDSDWNAKSDPQEDRPWRHDPLSKQPSSSSSSSGHQEAPMHHTFASPPPPPLPPSLPSPAAPVSVTLATEPAQAAGKVTEQIDSNANKVFVRTLDKRPEDASSKAGHRSDTKPLQPLKRRWSDPMHRAQLAPDLEKHFQPAKPVEPQ